MIGNFLMLAYWRVATGIPTVMYDSRLAATFSMAGRFNTQLSSRTEYFLVDVEHPPLMLAVNSNYYSQIKGHLVFCKVRFSTK
jgi:hypothetical protein